MFDLKNITGYEFEKIIGELLKRMGFSVEVTQASGDGGIDIIAHNINPIVSGKYLIQCKYWNSQIGQPVVRDLYGAVTHARANKGVIITTDTFSEQAINFASDVGIECINGNKLYDLMIYYGMSETSNNINTVKRFSDHPNFNKQKYQYLKMNIDKDKRNFDFYYDLFKFLRNYVDNDYIDLMYSGLLDELQELCDLIITRFKSKKYEDDRDKYKSYRTQIKFLKGELLDTFEGSNKTNPFRYLENHLGEDSINFTNNMIVISKTLGYSDIYNFYFRFWENSEYATDELFEKSLKKDDYPEWLMKIYRDEYNEAKKYWGNTPNKLLFIFKKLDFDLIRPHITNLECFNNDIKLINELVKSW